MTKEQQEEPLGKVKAAAKAEVETTLKAFNEEGEKKINDIVEKKMEMFKDLPADKLKKAVDDMTEVNAAIADMKSKMAAQQTPSKNEDFLKKKLKEVFPEMKKNFDQGNKSFSFKLEEKVQSTSDFGDRVIFGFREIGIDFAALPELFILDLISTMTGGPGSNPLSWIERVVKEVDVPGGIDALTPLPVAESAKKPNLGWTWEEKSVTSKTIAAIVPVTKQAVYNYPMLEQEVRGELLIQLAHALQRQILFGDGTGQNLFGINYYAKTFAAGALAGTVDFANEYDVLVAAATQILNQNYVPTSAIISHNSRASMNLTKNANGTYVLPPFSTAGGLNVYGLSVKSTTDMTGDNFLVGDFKKYLFNWVESPTVEVGMINDDFEKNIWRIRVELQGAGRVKAHEAFALVKGDFSVAKAALETA